MRLYCAWLGQWSWEPAADGPRPGQDGHFVAAIRVGAFEDVGRFKARVDGAIRQVRRCRPAPGFDRAYAPGEIEALNERAYRREGIPLNAVTLADLRRVADDLGIRGPSRPADEGRA